MTHHSDLNGFLKTGAPKMKKGPIALIFAEDEIELDTTIKHHLGAGFVHVVVFAMPEFAIAEDVAKEITRVDHNMLLPQALETTMNAVMKATGDVWIYYCYNAEFLFHPFCEHRTVGEMITFNVEERRNAILTYVIDLYAGDLNQDPNAVNIKDAHLDKTGYYALARKDRWNNDLDRQQDFFGGLRWRFEEHIPAPRRRIDRVALFRNQPNLVFNADHTFNISEYNTYACAWHHSLSATICSFRTAKALKRNPGSTYDIDTFKWHNSIKFEWDSQQLLNLGLMEPGQWF